jgi:hypothetical protein
MVHSQFTLYDLIADVTPGAVTIAVLISLLPAEHFLLTVLQEIGVFGGLTFVIFAYVAGHLLQAIASPIDTELAKRREFAYPFEDELSKGEPSDVQTEGAGEEEDRSLEEVSVNERFKTEIHDHFGAEFDDTDIFFLTQSQLWNEDVGRMKRFQILYTLFRSLWVIFSVGVISHIVILGAGLSGHYNPIWSPLGSGLLIVGLTIGAWLSFRRRRKMHQKMAKTMIIDFYANILSNKS